nr:GGDEF domain-containing protein [Gemmatimonas groenlandica]
MDHFKAVNDTLGHSAGDEVLREVARRIAAVLRAGDEVGRYGGEEFLVCLDEVSHEGLQITATRILQSIREHPIIIANQPIRVTESAGLAHSADFGRVNLERMIDQADRGLYEAREKGRDRYREVSPDESVRALEYGP